MNTTTYITLLGGINIGGHRVQMERLRSLFRELGLTNVRSYIQTGNVFFDTAESDKATLTCQIEQHLLEALGYAVPVFLRTTQELARTLQLDPFHNLEVTPDMRLLVVFTTEPLATAAALPLRSPKGDFELLQITPDAVFIVMRLLNGRPGNATTFMAKTCNAKGKMTTRFFHTAIKILEAARSAESA